MDNIQSRVDNWRKKTGGKSSKRERKNQWIRTRYRKA